MTWTELKQNDMFLYEHMGEVFLARITHVDIRVFEYMDILMYDENNIPRNVKNAKNNTAYYAYINSKRTRLLCTDQEEIINKFAEYLI